MTTELQLIANRQNALLSTGAATEEGKAIVAKNAVKHGIFSNDLIVVYKKIGYGDEERDAGKYEEKITDYQELLGNLMSSFNPQGQLEHLLVEKIAVDYWRIRRVLKFETKGIIRELNSSIPREPLPNDTDKIIRYESHLQKSIMQNIIVLKQI